MLTTVFSFTFLDFNIFCYVLTFRVSRDRSLSSSSSSSGSSDESDSDSSDCESDTEKKVSQQLYC